MKIEELADYLHNEVRARTEGDQTLEGPEDAFTAIMLEYLEGANEADGGELGAHKRAGRKNAPAYKINAWHLYGEGGACLDLFVSRYKDSAVPDNVNRSEVAEHFEWCRNFLKLALTGFGGRMEHLEPSAPPYEAAQTIFAGKESLDTVRIFLLTNGIAKQSGEQAAVVEGIDVRHFLWDLEKLHRLRTSGQERTVIALDFANDYGGGVPCLAQPDGTGEYTSYLAFFSASLLAQIYGDHGPRLLEKNVRSYLQARGKVNRGIQQTIREVPHRFLAYNNGLSATAESVQCSRSKDGLMRIESVQDFQIVNGGQTTASIYHALKKEKADIGNVVVQVKLTVVNRAELVVEFVPLISLYANSQNKVNPADFSANDVFHQKLEALSRTVWAPASEGLARPTRWYYERARGSHLDDQARAGTPAKQKAWLAEHPLIQKFTKTDVAKYDYMWDQLPHLVSRGAEKNFVEWTLARTKAGQTLPDQEYFQALVAKSILARRTEKIVAQQKQGGYRANVVAYALAWLSRDTGQRLDLAGIWKRQGLSGRLEQALGIISLAAFKYLVESAKGRDVTEWAKKEECWTGFRDVKIPIGDVSADLIPVGEVPPKGIVAKAAIGTKSSWQDLFAEIERMKPEVWGGLESWGQETGLLENWQMTMLSNFEKKLINGKKPNLLECKTMLEMLAAAREKGFTH